MRYSLLILLALFLFCSCNRPQVKSEGETHTEIDSVALDLLNSIYEGRADIFSEEWIDANCTSEMKQILIDAYDYDGEGFGSWIIGGWEAGEDIAQKVSAINNDKTDYFVTLDPADSDLPVKGHRVIRFSMVYVDGQPMIDKCVWVENYEWVE